LAALKATLLAVRSALELLALGALVYWGFSEFDGVLSVVLGIGAPLAAAVVWGLFVSPKARYSSTASSSASRPELLTPQSVAWCCSPSRSSPV
jgi:hypothetical protein